MHTYRYVLALPVLLAALTLAAPAQELTAKQIDTIWSDLIQHDEAGSTKALAGIAALAKSPKAAVPFLRDKLKPVAPADLKKINQTIADLDSGNFQTREQAAKTLESLGPVAAPAMDKKLQDKVSLEVRQALERLLGRIDDRAMTAEELRAVRAIEALEAIGTPDARAVLETLAKGGSGAIVTERASQGLARLHRRVAGK